MSEGLPFRAVVALGSNIDPETNLLAALRLLEARVPVVGRSRVYRSLAVGRESDPPFLNAALELLTELAPAALKASLLGPVETALGRVRGPDRFAPRTIDLDLVLFSDSTGRPLPAAAPWVDHDLERYPHVALPVADLDRRRSHPLRGVTLGELADALLVTSASPPSAMSLPGWEPSPTDPAGGDCKGKRPSS